MPEIYEVYQYTVQETRFWNMAIFLYLSVHVKCPTVFACCTHIGQRLCVSETSYILQVFVFGLYSNSSNLNFIYGNECMYILENRSDLPSSLQCYGPDMPASVGV